VALEIARSVLPRTVVGVVDRDRDFGAGGDRPLIVGIDVVHDHVDARTLAVFGVPQRVLVLLVAAKHHPTISVKHYRAGYDVTIRRCTETRFQPESVLQPLDRLAGILVAKHGEHGRDC
jgi:hypothetical protein